MEVIVNRQQADALARLTREYGGVTVARSEGSYLIVSFGQVARARLWTTGKLEVEETKDEVAQ